jgi:hypothetical protein
VTSTSPSHKSTTLRAQNFLKTANFAPHELELVNWWFKAVVADLEDGYDWQLKVFFDEKR